MIHEGRHLEDMRLLEGMTQRMLSSMVYGNETCGPIAFQGFIPRYGSTEDYLDD